ncbi:hypothetical protein DWF00_06995, partial [Bosea caraganae]
AVAHLDEMTQQNAALAEQSAASAASLSGRIGELNTLVAAFKTGQENEAQAPIARPRIVTNAKTPAALRQLAEAAFTQSKAVPPRQPAKKVANAGSHDAGWEEF